MKKVLLNFENQYCSRSVFAKNNDGDYSLFFFSNCKKVWLVPHCHIFIKSIDLYENNQQITCYLMR